MSLEGSTTNSSKPSSAKDGIDIHKALDILSLRSSGEKNSSVDHHHDCHKHAPEGGKAMGQTINLVDNDDSLPTHIEDQRKDLQEKRKKREIEIRKRFESMKVLELLNSVMEAQEGRVAAYREFNEGLENILKSGNLTNYTAICAQATASFSVISDTIKTIQSTLQKKYHRKDLVEMVTMLQQKEQEKLNVTAALHLERIRASGAEGEENVTMHLLQDGISALQQNNANCVEAINEVLDELRFAIADEA